MGRTTLVFALLIFYFTSTTVFALDVTVSHSTLSHYYFGGEYIIFRAKIKPNTTEDSKQMDGKQYLISTHLASSGIFVAITTNDGLKIFHPLPDDYYKVVNNTCTLKFYLPKNKGVYNISIRVFGYVPGSASRISNITILNVKVGSSVLYAENVTVVNRQKFFEDIRTLEKEKLSPAEKELLDEALMLYNVGDYIKSNILLNKIESKLHEYQFEKEKLALKSLLDNLKDELSELKNQIIVIRTKLDVEKGKIENYDLLKSREKSLEMSANNIDAELYAAEKLIDNGDFSQARLKLNDAKKSLENLRLSVAKLSIELNSAKKKSGFSINWLYLIPAALVGLIIAALVIYRKRRSL